MSFKLNGGKYNSPWYLNQAGSRGLDGGILGQAQAQATPAFLTHSYSFILSLLFPKPPPSSFLPPSMSSNSQCAILFSMQGRDTE